LRASHSRTWPSSAASDVPAVPSGSETNLPTASPDRLPEAQPNSLAVAGFAVRMMPLSSMHMMQSVDECTMLLSNASRRRSPS
jgi:hypothetical protein